MKIQLCIIFLPTVFAALNIFTVEYAVDCPSETNLPITTHIIIENGTVPNKIFYSGYLEIKEKVPAPFEFAFEINRCDLKAEKCEKYTNLKLPGICKFFNSKTGIFTDMLDGIQPRLKCPLMPGKHVFNDSSVDVSSFAILPVEAYRFVTTLKGTSGNGKNKKLAACIRIDGHITNARRSGK